MLEADALPRVILRPAKHLLERWVDSRIRSVTGLLPIHELRDEDVFIAGYPKSGTTWLQHIVASIAYGMNPEHVPDTLVQDLVPEVHYRRYYRRYRTPMFFKSHELPNAKYRRVIYLLRDGRDVMVSYFHYVKALRGEEIDFLKMVRDGEGLFPCKWHEHVESWLSNPYNADILVMKYEYLKSNPIPELQRLCSFLRIETCSSYLELVAQKTSFEMMRQKEIRYGWDNAKWPRDKAFVRRGEVGSYKDEMPRSVVEVFLEEAGPTLRKCGYV